MNVEVWPRRASRACLIGNAGTLVVVDWGRVTAQNLMIENLMKPNLLKKSSLAVCLIVRLWEASYLPACPPCFLQTRLVSAVPHDISLPKLPSAHPTPVLVARAERGLTFGPEQGELGVEK